MVKHAYAFVIAYVVGTYFLMRAANVWLGLADPAKPGLWEILWPLHCVLHAPLALAAIVVVARSRLPEPKMAILLWFFLLLILTSIAISLFLDGILGDTTLWMALVAEWVGLAVVFVLIVRLVKRWERQPSNHVD